MASDCIGIDVGATTIKAARVRLGDGELVSRPKQLPTPKTPIEMATKLAAIVAELALGDEPPASVGVALPGTLWDRRLTKAVNLGPAFSGWDAADALETMLARPVAILNDADAAGLAEGRFGALRGTRGQALLLTIGTGVGSALLDDGMLFRGTEIGQLPMAGGRVEDAVSLRARRARGDDWATWTARLESVLDDVVATGFPGVDTVVVGGRAAEQADRWLPLLSAGRRVRIADLRNDAGIVGAALHAVEVAGPLARGVPVPPDR